MVLCTAIPLLGPTLHERPTDCQDLQGRRKYVNIRKRHLVAHDGVHAASVGTGAAQLHRELRWQITMFDVLLIDQDQQGFARVVGPLRL